MINSTMAAATDDFNLAPDELNKLWRTLHSSPSDQYHNWISLATFTFAILGTMTNFMSVVVLLKLSTKLSTFVYLTSLSISDMITCLTFMMIQIFEYLIRSQRNRSIIIIIHYIANVFGALVAGSRVLSLWISTAVTMDRWILICYPSYGKRFCVLKRAKVICITLFLMALLYSIPLAFEYQPVDIPSPSIVQDSNDPKTKNISRLFKNSIIITKGYSDLAQRRIYRWFYMFFNCIFVYTVPTLTIVFFNLQLIRALSRLQSRTKRLRRRTVNSSSSTNTNHDRFRFRFHFYRSKYSITIMVIAIVFALLLCRSPTFVLWILWSFELTIKTFFDSKSRSIARRFHLLANLIAIINAATNFIPFCVFGQLFRDKCLTIYCCRPQLQEHSTHQTKTNSEDRYQHIQIDSRHKTSLQERQAFHMKNDCLINMNSMKSGSVSDFMPTFYDQYYSMSNIK